MAVNWEKLVTVHQKIKAKYKADQEAWNVKEAKYKGDLEELTNFMQSIMNDEGINSVKTDAGTVFRKAKIIPQASDWGAFYAWVKENDAFDALEKRIKGTFIATYMEENDDALPPGVSVFKKYEVGVRKA
jgi:predicted HNH restriction endonuclease